MIFLGIDTCGTAGSVALARASGDSLETIAQTELAGGTYSATLVAAVEELLRGQGIALRDIGCIVIVNGPGSFTGVRVGISAAKGLADGAAIPVVAVSRLEVLARKAGAGAAALDAHRHELFLRLAGYDPVELLAGADDLARLPRPGNLAICDDTTANLIGAAWPAVALMRFEPPTAADALLVAAPAIAAQRFADIALLDGHYLRRSDAEIFGNTVSKS